MNPLEFFIVNEMGNLDKRPGGFQVTMYHGIQGDTDREYEMRAHDGRRVPVDLIHLTMNTFELRSVVLPGIDLVVSRSIRDRLEGTAGLIFLDVVFDYLFRLDWRDMRIDAPNEIIDPDRFLKSLSDAEREAMRVHESDIGPYFEMLPMQYNDIASDFAESVRITLYVESSVYGPDRFKIRVSRALFERYPILDSDLGILFSESHFAKVSDELDRRFFDVLKVTVDKGKAVASPG